jgi:hypothetical protein
MFLTLTNSKVMTRTSTKFLHIYLFSIDQKIKTMSPTELLQSRTTYDNDPESMQTTLSQYQTPTYLAK